MPQPDAFYPFQPITEPCKVVLHGPGNGQKETTLDRQKYPTKQNRKLKKMYMKLFRIYMENFKTWKCTEILDQ